MDIIIKRSSMSSIMIIINIYEIEIIILYNIILAIYAILCSRRHHRVRNKITSIRYQYNNIRVH